MGITTPQTADPKRSSSSSVGSSTTADPVVPGGNNNIANTNHNNNNSGNHANSNSNNNNNSGGGGNSALEGVNTRHVLREIFSIGFPLSLSQICQFSIILVVMLFVGGLGVEEIGAASIAVGILNATGFAFGSGLCGALETVLSQSYGSNPKSKMFGVYAQRMFVMLMLTCIPLGLLLNNVGRLLIWMGQSETIAELVGSFCHIWVVGIPFMMVLELLRRYYAAQRVTAPLSVTLVAAALLNPFIQHIMVTRWKYNGVAWGWMLLTIAMVVALFLHLRLSGLYKQTWGGLSFSALQHWGPLLRLAAPSLGMAFSEWTTLEINSVCAGYGTEEELAAYAISSQAVTICWSITSGVFIASSVLVGNAIGARQPGNAKRIAYLSMVIVLVMSIVNCAVVVLLGSLAAKAFNKDESVIEIYVEMIPRFLAYHIVDAQQSNILGVLRGCGLQNVGFVVAMICYAVVGIPLGLIMFLKFDYGINALWDGPTFGVAIIAAPAYYYIFNYYIRWESLEAHAEETIVLTKEMESLV